MCRYSCQSLWISIQGANTRHEMLMSKQNQKNSKKINFIWFRNMSLFDSLKFPNSMRSTETFYRFLRMKKQITQIFTGFPLEWKKYSVPFYQWHFSSATVIHNIPIYYLVTWLQKTCLHCKWIECWCCWINKCCCVYLCGSL